MKIPKLLIIGVLASSLCVAVPAVAVTNSLVLTFSVDEDYTYCDGIVHYELILTNQDIAGANPATVDITFNPPGPTGASGAYGGTITLDTDVAIPVGTVIKYNYDGSDGGIAKPALSVDLGAIPLSCSATVAYALAGFDGIYNADPQYDAIDSRNIPVAVINPSTDVGISAEPLTICSGTDSDVTLTVTEQNDGTGALTSPSVEVYAGAVLIETLTAAPDSGDDGDGKLEPGETWSWDVLVAGVNATTTFTAVGHGLDALGNDVTWCDPQQDPPADTICDQDELATVEVTAVDPPECSIDGPDEVCENSTDNQYCGPEGMTEYSWAITDGDASIPGATDGECVLVTAGTSATFTLELTITDENGCSSTCEKIVTVNEGPACSIEGPDPVCNNSTGHEYCGPQGMTGYSWAITDGDASIDGDADGQCVLVDVGAAGTFTLELTITDENGCSSTCEKIVTVNDDPACSIDGPNPVCVDSIGNIYCGPEGMASYAWEVTSGDAQIDGAANEECVVVDAGAAGIFTIQLTIIDQDGCEATCSEDITVEDCGQTFCSFTQGFWGNAGGKSCGGQTTTDLINLALANAGGEITVGISPRSITFNSAACILASLPAGGKPSALPAVGGPWTCADLSSFYKNKNKTEIDNVLVGQAVALTLNLLVSDGCVEDAGDLATWVIPGDFCTVPYGHEEACAEYTMMPESLIGKTVQEVLDAVNAALAGTGSIGDAYAGATGINEGFDECRTVVPCIRPEICDNGCDDDGDGLIDGEDPDCQPD